jgi:hypothetical protein
VGCDGGWAPAHNGPHSWIPRQQRQNVPHSSVPPCDAGLGDVRSDVRPFGSVAGNFFLIVSNFGALLVAILVAMQVFDLSSDSAEWAQMTALVFGAIASLQAALQLAFAARRPFAAVVRRLRAAARRVMRGPVNPEDTSSTVPLVFLMADLDNEDDADDLLIGRSAASPEEASHGSEATSPHPTRAVSAIDVLEARNLDTDRDFWRESERVSAARYVLRSETELADKSRSELFRPLKSEMNRPVSQTNRKTRHALRSERITPPIRQTDRKIPAACIDDASVPLAVLMAGFDSIDERGDLPAMELAERRAARQEKAFNDREATSPPSAGAVPAVPAAIDSRLEKLKAMI